MALETQETKASLHLWHRKMPGESSSGRVEGTVISSSWNLSAEKNPTPKRMLHQTEKNKKNHFQAQFNLKLNSKSNLEYFRTYDKFDELLSLLIRDHIHLQ